MTEDGTPRSDGGDDTSTDRTEPGDDAGANIDPTRSPDDTDRSDGHLPIERRDLLKWGVVGAAVDRSWLPGRSPLADDSPGDPTDRGAPRTVPTKTQPRDYLPMDYPLSIRGIAPESYGNPSDQTWLTGQRMSVRGLLSDQGFNRRPVSLREIVTPQVTGNRIATWGGSWENWLQDHGVQNARDHTLGTKKKAIEAVHDTITTNFRAVGSGHSHSEAAKPEENYTDVRSISGRLSLDWIRGASDQYWNRTDTPTREHLVRLGAGTVLQTINRGILRNVNPELGLPNMGSWDGQTLAGAINTSTHGTGLGLGSFADLVRSVDVITAPESPVADGEPVVRMFRVEPEDGITDPVAFGNATNEHDMTLIQNDDVFHEVVVGYGSLGVAYSYTLELQKSYWLHERTWIDSLQAIDPYRDAQNHRHYSFLVDLTEPQLTGTNDPVVRVRTRHDRDPNGNPVRANGRSPTERAKSGENLFDNLMYEIYERFRRRVEPAQNPSNRSNWADPVQAVGDGRVFLGNLVQQSLTPSGAPFERNRHETASHIALRRTRAEVLDPAKDPNPPNQNALTLEIGVPADRVKPAIRTILDRLKQPGTPFVVSPLGVRFTSRSDHKLSPEYDRETAMLEIIQPLAFRLRYPVVGKAYVAPVEDGPLQNQDYADFQDEFGDGFAAFLGWQKLKALLQNNNMEHFWEMSAAKDALEVIEEPLLRQYDGRPHMGKHNTLDWQSSTSVKRPQNMYPAYDDWLDAFEYFNAFGTFDAEFTDNKVEKRGNRP